MKTEQEHIHVNTSGEFDEGCICGSSDFFTVTRHGEDWKEIEPVTQWQGWACVNCRRVYEDNGVVITKPKIVTFLGAGATL